MPLDALTTQRIRALEIVMAWVIESSMADPPGDYMKEAMNPTYILEFAEKIEAGQAEVEDG